MKMCYKLAQQMLQHFRCSPSPENFLRCSQFTAYMHIIRQVVVLFRCLLCIWSIWSTEQRGKSWTKIWLMNLLGEICMKIWWCKGKHTQLVWVRAWSYTKYAVCTPTMMETKRSKRSFCMFGRLSFIRRYNMCGWRITIWILKEVTTQIEAWKLKTI